MIYDLLIIGAGATGSMTAYALAKYDLKVAVAEAQYDIASGTTKANSAIVHAGYDAEPGTLKALLNPDGCRMMEGITKKLGVHFSKCGSHVVAFSEKEIEHLNLLLDRGGQNGVEELYIIDQAALREMEPNISEHALASLWAPNAGIVCPYDLAIAGSENACVNGTDFYLNYKVAKITQVDGHYEVESEDGEKISAKYIANSAGLYAENIAEIAGEIDFPVKISPRRGEYMIMDKMYGDMVKSVLFAVPNENGKGILVSPTVDENLIVGPNARVVESKLNTDTTDEGMEEISKGAHHLVPSLNLRGVITSFAGVRSTSNIGDFYLQASTQLPNFVHAAGIESPGLASSPAVGEYIAKLLFEIGLPKIPRENYIESRGEHGNFVMFKDLSDNEKAERIKNDPSFGKIVCRCETITEGDILQSIRRPLGAKNLDMIKKRVRAGMGRCQGGFCSPRAAELLSQELNLPLNQTKKSTKTSWLLGERTK